MKIGLVARAENRGLGILTWEFFRHMHPLRTLVVDMGELARGFEPHFERYPEAQRVSFDGVNFVDEQLVRDWLDDLDVLYTAETPYDWRLFEWAREQGVRTVCHVMPEFYKWAQEPTLPRPDAVWTPTSWRQEMLDDAVHVPVPVALDRFEPRLIGNRARPLRFMHVAGHKAIHDRAGTAVVLDSLAYQHTVHALLIRSQDQALPRSPHAPSNITLDVQMGGVDDYWQLYRGVDVLVQPRRYGGLSLPFQEAMAAGVPVIVPDADPYARILPMTLPFEHTRHFRSQVGQLPLIDVRPTDLARTIDTLSEQPEIVDELSARARQWAVEHSWERWRTAYISHFCDVLA